jgi:hypothetical protein
VQTKYRSQTAKSNLKLIPAAKPAMGLRLGGLVPSAEMNPGEYVASCETAWVESIGKGTRVVLQFRVIDGPHTGTALRQWLPASDAGGVVSPLGRYAKHCAIVLGRPLDVDDDLNNPAAIFSGAIFSVYAGFRKTERQRGGAFSDKNALVKKDDADYLRVHEIRGQVEL